MNAFGLVAILLIDPIYPNFLVSPRKILAVDLCVQNNVSCHELSLDVGLISNCTETSGLVGLCYNASTCFTWYIRTCALELGSLL
jgi:hypothetical protein